MSKKLARTDTARESQDPAGTPAHFIPDFETTWQVLNLAGRNKYGAQLYAAVCPGCGAISERTKSALKQGGVCRACAGRQATALRVQRDAAELAADAVTGWTVLEEAGRTEHGAPQYRVQCQGCSRIYLRTKVNILKNVQCQSCASTTQATKHGMSGTPFYAVWKSMLQRCLDPNSRHYASYGGRGITVCPAWHRFEAFYADMYEGYAEGLQLDRTDNDQGYAPANCRWVTPSENSRNRRNARLITAFGRTENLCVWAAELKCSPSVISLRLSAGWTPEAAVSTPARANRRSKQRT